MIMYTTQQCEKIHVGVKLLNVANIVLKFVSLDSNYVIKRYKDFFPLNNKPLY